MKHFVYLRGNPGVGKITVARLLEKELGWKVLWFHDLKNAVYNVVKEHRIPRLMDEVTAPVIKHLLNNGESFIYTRCSPDKETVERIRSIANKYPDFVFTPVLLTATYDTLLERIASRDDPYRITSKQDLDNYMNGRPTNPIEGELIVATDGLTPGQVAKEILKSIQI